MSTIAVEQRQGVSAMKKAAVILMILLFLTMISACSQIKPTTIPESGSVTPESEPYSFSESRTEDPLVVTSSEPISSSETEATDPSTSELPEEQSPDGQPFLLGSLIGLSSTTPTVIDIADGVL